MTASKDAAAHEYADMCRLDQASHLCLEQTGREVWMRGQTLPCWRPAPPDPSSRTPQGCTPMAQVHIDCRYFWCFAPAPGPAPSPALPLPHCWQMLSPGSRLHLCSAWSLMQPLHDEFDPQMRKGICTMSPKPAAEKAKINLHFSATFTGAQGDNPDLESAAQ